MRINAFLLSPFFFIKGYGQSAPPNTPTTNNLICQYQLKYLPDTTSKDRKNTLFELRIGNQFSLFKEKTAFTHDSLINAYEGLPFDEKNANLLTIQIKKTPFPSFTYSIYKNKKSQDITVIDKIGGKNYQYEENKNLFNWHVQPEKVVVLGYTCQKAITNFAGRTWTAWFTREIPVSDGPYKFEGLPGLIIQLADSREHYVFSLLKLQKPFAPLLTSPPVNNVAKTTKQAFLQGKTDYIASAAARISALGNSVTDAQKQAYQEKIKKRNNPLELQ